MLVDTHCHINMMVKNTFDIPLKEDHFALAHTIAQEAEHKEITKIINAGTSLIESENCIHLAQKNIPMYAAVGIHPCDAKLSWQKDLKDIEQYIKAQEKNKIVAIGECGLDLYHPGYNLQRQKDLLRAHIELSLKYNLALTIHMRNATDEMVATLDEFKGEQLKGVMHCFYEEQTFANYVIALGLSIGISGIITYPKNESLRNIVASLPLDKIVLETDAPYLPPQIMRGKQNHPQYIKEIATYIANLKKQSLEFIAEQTTKNAYKIFGFDQFE